MKDPHKRASRILGIALALDNLTGWESAAMVWAGRLTVGERAALLMAVLSSLHPEEAFAVIENAYPRAGEPSLTPWLDPRDEAKAWAGYAMPGELLAYAFAAFEAMSPRNQAAFFRRISTMEVPA